MRTKQEVVDTIPRFVVEGKVVQVVQYDLPLPPSLWRLYMNRGDGGRKRTPNYEGWIAECGYGNQWPYFHDDPTARFALDIDLGLLADSGPHGSDLDNRVKAVQDLVAEMLHINDKRCDWVAVYRNPHSHDGTRAHVSVIILQEAVDDDG